jgi:putative PEP-CTERM system TPR-repeat lipoprotein
MHLKSVHSALLLAMLAAPVLSGCNPDSNLTAQERVQRAKDFESKGDLKASVIELKNALQKSPDDAQARWLLGLIYLKQGQANDAETQLNRAVQLGINPDSVRIPLARAWLLKGDYNQVLDKLQPTGKETANVLAQIFELRGTALFNSGKANESCPLFEQAIQADSAYSPAYLGRAKCEYAHRQTAQAIATAQKASALEPQRMENWYLLGELYRETNQPQQALNTYNQALKIKPNDYSALAYKIMVQLALNQTDSATKGIAQLVELQPHAYMTLYLQAYLAYIQGKYNLSTDMLQQVLRIDPNNLQALLLFGTVNYAAKQDEIALNSFNKVLAIADLPQARLLLAATQLRMNMPNDALKTLAPLLARGNDAKALLLAGQITLNQGDYAKGLAYLRQASQLDPNDTTIRTSLASNQLLTGDQQGISGLESVITQNPQETQAYLLLASAQITQNNLNAAMTTLQKMAAAQAKNPLPAMLMGRIYERQNNPVAARKSFERSLAVDPKFQIALAALADLDIRENKPEQARQRFKTLLTKTPDDLGVLLGQARVDLALDDSTSYIADLKNTIQKHPNAHEPVILLTRFYIQQAHQPNLALDVAQKAQRAYPDDLSFMNNLGQAQLAVGRKTDAIATYTNLSNLQPNSPVAWYQLGWAQRASGNLGAALLSLQKAISIAPAYVDARIALAGVLVAQGQNDAAIKESKAIQAALPQASAGYNLEAELYARLNKPEQSLQVLARGMQTVQTRDMTATYHLALIRAGQVAKAEQVAQAWLKGHPGDIDFRLYLASIYLNHDQSAQAIAEYRKVLQSVPNNVNALNNLAALLQAKNDPSAITYAKQAYGLQPDSPIVADTYGWSLLKQGDEKAALAPLELAARALPQQASIQYHLAAALVKSGDTARAQKLLQTILAGKQAFAERNDAVVLQQSISGAQ